MVPEIIGQQRSDTYIWYFVVEEYSRESHFLQSDCDSIEWQIEFVIKNTWSEFNQISHNGKA